MTEYHDVAWMSQRIGMSAHWIYTNKNLVPHHRIGRYLRFTEANAAAFERQTYREPRRMETTGRKRHRAA